MSGGHFQYKQWEIGHIADEVETLILNNNEIEGCGFTDSTIAEFKNGLNILRVAHIYAQRIDWLVSGDDGEDSFIRRLEGELKKLEILNTLDGEQR